MNVKKRLRVVMLALLLLLLLPVQLSASAEEIYPGTGYQLRWGVVNGSGRRWIKVDDSHMAAGTCYSPSIVQSALRNWTNAGTKALCTDAGSITYSNVDLSTASDSWWDKHCDDNANAQTVAYVNQQPIINFSDLQAAASPGRVNVTFDAFMFNTEDPIGGWQNSYINTVIHEIGHVYGMGHTVDPNSLMYRENTSVISLNSYDIGVMNSFYP